MVPKSKLIDTKLADEDYCYITTVGRVTGKPHTVEIWFGTNGDTIYVLAGSGRDADFVKNAKKQPVVDVRIATTMFAGNARIVTETREDTLARELLMKKYVKASTSDLVEWGRDALPVAFDLVAP
jgi:deazaflavin-dependent oxidoreductase (nitroreductase family)